MFFIEGNGERTTSLHTELKKRSAVRTLQKKESYFQYVKCGPRVRTWCGHILAFFHFWGNFRSNLLEKWSYVPIYINLYQSAFKCFNRCLNTKISHFFGLNVSWCIIMYQR